MYQLCKHGKQDGEPCSECHIVAEPKEPLFQPPYCSNPECLFKLNARISELEGNHKKMIEALCRVTYAMWSALLNGGKSCAEEWASMNNYQVGDIVIEISSLFRPVEHCANTIGYVIELRHWCWGSKAVKLKRLIDGKIVDWNNCKFIRVPHGRELPPLFEGPSEDKQ